MGDTPGGWFSDDETKMMIYGFEFRSAVPNLLVPKVVPSKRSDTKTDGLAFRSAVPKRLVPKVVPSKDETRRLMA